VRMVVAAFDFDGTLTRSDSVVPFLRLVGGRRKLVFGLLRQAPSVVRAAVRRDRDRLKALATAAVFRDLPRSRIDELARTYGRSLAVTGLRDDVVARLGWHLEQGHLVVIVSASYEPYVSVVAEALNVSNVVATRLELDAADVCTGGIELEPRGDDVRHIERLGDDTHVGLVRGRHDHHQMTLSEVPAQPNHDVVT